MHFLSGLCVRGLDASEKYQLAAKCRRTSLKNVKTPGKRSDLRCGVAPRSSFERGLHAGEGGVELRAEALDNGNDRNGDAGGNQAIFNGGRARLVLHKTPNQVAHDLLLASTRGCLNVIATPF